MRRLELTLATAAENVALDEALLLEAEASTEPCEVLRIWEPALPLVVVGRSSSISDEVNIEECRGRDIPVLRRSSGGAAIVSGPGCLMYGVVISYARHPALKSIDNAHAWILEKLAASLRSHLPGVSRQGISDLALDGRKVSGNSLRCKRNHFLYHGTLLYQFPLELIETCLRMPARQPAYRQGRSHRDFVTNLPLDVDLIRAAVIDAFAATEEQPKWPQNAVQTLVEEKFGRTEF